MIVRRRTSQRARPAAELCVIHVTAVFALDDQLAVRKERTVLAAVRNVRALHVDLLGMRRRAECILRRTPVVAAIRCRCAKHEQPVRLGDLQAAAGAQLDAVLGPADIGRREALHVAEQRDVGADGERVAIVQDDVCRDGNCGGQNGIRSDACTVDWVFMFRFALAIFFCQIGFNLLQRII